MKVLCIFDGVNFPEEAIIPKKGTIYTVSKQIINNVQLEDTNSFLWYELEETGTWIHHHSIFVTLIKYDKVKQR